MPDLRRRNCIVCGGHVSKVGSISWRGKCAPCGRKRAYQAIIELSDHKGPTFDHWRARVAASVGGVLLDAKPVKGQTDGHAD